MKILDLFCGGGGASVGMAKYGDITGIDMEPQPEYPFKFIRGDALGFDIDFYRQFDIIWSSPPCQAYSVACANARKQGKEYPDLIEATRDLLLKVNKPFVIENVPGSPLITGLLLCGSMFNLNIVRHRFFEIGGFYTKQPDHARHNEDFITVVGSGGSDSVLDWQRALNVFHIKSRYSLAQAVPPAYSDYILKQFLYYGPSNQIFPRHNTKTHRMTFHQNGKEIFETSKAKGEIIIKFMKETLPGVL